MHCSYPYDQPPCYSDNRPVGAPGVLQFQTLCPHQRVSAHKEPGTFEKGHSHLRVLAPGDPTLPDKRILSNTVIDILLLSTTTDKDGPNRIGSEKEKIYRRRGACFLICNATLPLCPKNCRLISISSRCIRSSSVNTNIFLSMLLSNNQAIFRDFSCRFLPGCLTLWG